jgi:sec-independent protein translocase protein TatB
VFGLSFSELCLLVIVAIVVIGPKDLPKVLRKAGQMAGKLRRLASDVRAQSGIDEVLRADGLHEDIAEIRKLAQGDFLAPVARAAAAATSMRTSVGTNEVEVVREREYPRDGADSYDATPDSAVLYGHHSTPSPLADDPLYVLGDKDSELPKRAASEPETKPTSPAPDAP